MPEIEDDHSVTEIMQLALMNLWGRLAEAEAPLDALELKGAQWTTK